MSWYLLRNSSKLVAERDDEPLRLEVEHFLDCVATGATPRSDGHDGLRVVQVLENMQKSLESGGTPIAIEQPAGV